jgi:ArsR family transcriptional regulator
MNKLTLILRALSNETRLRILNIVLVRDCCVYEIVLVLAISQPIVSHHLSAMCNAGLMKMSRRGSFSVYAIDWKNLEAYVVDLLKDIRRGLEGNKLAEEDLSKLAQIECALPKHTNTA